MTKILTRIGLALALTLAFLPVSALSFMDAAQAEEAVDADAALTAQASNTDRLKITGNQRFDMIKQVLSLVNKERKARGVAEMKLDATLTDAAMQRAAELSIYYSLAHPDGVSQNAASLRVSAELRAAGPTSAQAVMNTWFYDEKQVLEWQEKGITLEKAIEGKYKLPSGTVITRANATNVWRVDNYANLINPGNVSLGLGCFYQSGQYYWDQLLSTKTAQGNVGTGVVNNHSTTITVNYARCATGQAFNMGYNFNNKSSLAPGETFTMQYCIRNAGWSTGYCTIDASNATWKSSNTNVCTVNSKGVVTAKAVGKATITATLPSGRSITHTWSVKQPIGSASVTGVSAQTYTGSQVKPVPTVTLGGKKLVNGTDYTLSYKDNVNVGTKAQVIITGAGNYSGTKTVSFEIKPAKITSVSLSRTKFIHDGTEKKPSLTVRAGNITLSSSDYTVSWLSSDLASLGTKTVQVTAKGNFTGTLKATYQVVPKGTPGVYDDDDDFDPTGKTQVMYRLYNPNSGEHFYTASANERDGVINAGWNYEGKGWTAPTKSDTPVYRLYSGTDHHYTTSTKERDSLVKAGWKYEGIGWYSDDDKGVPLYRQFNPNVQPTAPRNNSGSHNYTTSKTENDNLVKVGWKAEGIAWYGIKK